MQCPLLFLLKKESIEEEALAISHSDHSQKICVWLGFIIELSIKSLQARTEPWVGWMDEWILSLFEKTSLLRARDELLVMYRSEPFWKVG